MLKFKLGKCMISFVFFGEKKHFKNSKVSSCDQSPVNLLNAALDSNCAHFLHFILPSLAYSY